MVPVTTKARQVAEVKGKALSALARQLQLLKPGTQGAIVLSRQGALPFTLRNSIGSLEALGVCTPILLGDGIV